MRNVIGSLLLTVLTVLPTAALAKPPRAELAGVRLGMAEADAQARLSKLGKRTSEKDREREEDEQESWSLSSGPWGYVTFGVEEGRVSWVTVFARREGPHVLYRDLGSIAEARRTGTYFFTWTVPGHAGAEPYTVIARGSDSLRVSSVSLLPNPQEAVRTRPAPSDSSR